METATDRSALLLIDVQESFRGRPYWQADELPTFLANTQALIHRCRQAGVAVLQVFHQEPAADPGNPFHPESGLIRTLEGLDFQPDAVFYKEVHSALFGKNREGVTLEQWLRAQGIEQIFVTGIRTEQCCETTTRHASDVGFEVQFVADATLTFPMQSRSGKTFSASDIRERTELVLDGRFARIVSAAELIT